MLREDQKKLRWSGIDMRSRTVRRIAVLATYIGFLVAIWTPPARTYGVVMLLFWAGVVSSAWPAIEEATSVWMRRAVAVVMAVVGIALYVLPKGIRGRDESDLGLWAVTVLAMNSVVGWGKLVELSGRGWLGKAVREGEPMSAWKQRRLARMGFAIGLEGFARYEYGMKFRQLTAERKVEIGGLRAANPRGKWMRERGTVLFDDERIWQEDNRLRARVQRVMSWVLGVSAIGWWWASVCDAGLRPWMMVNWAWTVAGLSVTLRQAIVLWVEDDPRAVGEELGVVGQEA